MNRKLGLMASMSALIGGVFDWRQRPNEQYGMKQFAAWRSRKPRNMGR